MACARMPKPATTSQINAVAWPLRWVRRLGRGDKSLKKLADPTRLERATFAFGAGNDATGSRIFNDLADQGRSTGAFLAAVCPLRSRAQSEFATGHSTCVLRRALTQGPQTRPLQPVGLPDRLYGRAARVLKGGTVTAAERDAATVTRAVHDQPTPRPLVIESCPTERCDLRRGAHHQWLAVEQRRAAWQAQVASG